MGTSSTKPCTAIAGDDRSGMIAHITMSMIAHTPRAERLFCAGGLALLGALALQWCSVYGHETLRVACACYMAMRWRKNAMCVRVLRSA